MTLDRLLGHPKTYWVSALAPRADRCHVFVAYVAGWIRGRDTNDGEVALGAASFAGAVVLLWSTADPTIKTMIGNTDLYVMIAGTFLLLKSLREVFKP